MARILVAVALALLSFPLFAGTYVVTTNADSGAGSLRQGILDANSGACDSPCAISFAAPTTIDLQSGLPAIRVDHVTIGGSAVVIHGGAAGNADGLRIEGAEYTTLKGLTLSGFARHGLVLDHAKITTADTCDFFDNGGNGVLIVDSGSFFARTVNVAGNRGNGIYATRSSVLDIAVCRLGGDELGRGGNGANGIHVNDTEAVYLAFNRIAFNGNNGVLVTGTRREVDIEYNVFFDNGLLGIDFDADGPTEDRAPVITSAVFNRGWVRIMGTVHSKPNALVRVQPYSVGSADPSGHGEGQDVLFSFRTPVAATTVRTNAQGDATFVAYKDDPQRKLRGGAVTAIATHVENEGTGFGTTSEFARNAQVVDGEVSYTITTTADSGPGSLRDAIEQANRDEQCLTFFPCGIAFQIAEQPQNGVFTIRPRSALPAITRSAVWVDAATQTQFSGDTNPAGPEIEINGALCAGCDGLVIRATADTTADEVLIRDLTINGFPGDGVVFDGGSPRIVIPAGVDGCYIGTDPTGTRAVPNGRSGVRVRDSVAYIGAIIDNRIDARAPKGCLISGNGEHGIAIEGNYAYVLGNRIGTDATSFNPIPNAHNGIAVQTGSLLKDNIVAFNIENGISIGGRGGASVVAGQIHSNGGAGIAVSRAEFAKAPAVVSARADGDETRVTVQLDATPPTGGVQTYQIALYACSFTDTSGNGEGRRFLTTVFSRGGGERKEVVIRENLAGKFITATATPFDLFAFLPNGTTSMFSNGAQVTTDSCPTSAPVALSPAPDFAAGGPVTFRWSPVEGATEYRVWTMKFGDMPRIAFRGAATEATVALDSGTYDWVVEARFDPCYGTQSEHRIVNVNR